MKQRILPESFWIPPELNDNIIFSSALDSPVREEPRVDNIIITSPPDTHLLFSLFKILEQNQPEQAEPAAKCAPSESGRSIEEQTNVVRANEMVATYDSPGVFDGRTDPYLCSTKQHVAAKTEVKFNYSDMLSDLVVNL